MGIAGSKSTVNSGIPEKTEKAEPSGLLWLRLWTAVGNLAVPGCFARFASVKREIDYRRCPYG